jgi:hypothetical protein
MLDNPFGHFWEIPEEHRPTFQALCQDVAMLHLKWETYVTLFGPAADAVTRSNLADGFFRIIEDSLRVDFTSR